mmetsp:Transcript_26978/g.48888  ORF Transcript_26978/g.48888 Transcript_26978/m.48888 type:complete len:221 (+) Transcript_26978:153-815(+)
MRLDLAQHLLIDTGEGFPGFNEACIHQTADFVDAVFVDCDLDSGLVFVVAPPDLVPDGHDGLKVRQKVSFGQEVIDNLANHGRPAKAATNDHLKAARAIALQHAQADIVGFRHGAIIGGAGDGDLELARHELEFRMIRRPLAQEFCDRARIRNFVGGGSGEMVCGHISDRVSRGLDGMHADLGQRVQHVGHVLERGPVVLDVLAGREVAIALVPTLGDVR